MRQARKSFPNLMFRYACDRETCGIHSRRFGYCAASLCASRFYVSPMSLVFLFINGVNCTELR